jgi:hypothetical protein
MMVPLGDGIEACDGAHMSHAPHEAQLDERFEGSVDGGAGDTPQAARKGIEDLIRRWVVTTVEDFLEHCPTLEGHRYAALATSRLQNLNGRVVLHSR